MTLVQDNRAFARRYIRAARGKDLGREARLVLVEAAADIAFALEARGERVVALRRSVDAARRKIYREAHL